jgi:hypothetical protein
MRKLRIPPRQLVRVPMQDLNSHNQKMIQQEANGLDVKSWRFGLMVPTD